VTVLDHFLTAGVSRESVDECLVAAQIAMGGQRYRSGYARASSDRRGDHALAV